MKDEIKEILDRLKDSATNQIIDVPVMGGVSEPIDNSQCLEPNECKILLDYITNLQEDLDYQKQAEIEYNEKHTKLMKKYKKLQERKDKAIKYLEEPNRDNFDYSKANLLNILNGGDEKKQCTD